MKLSDWLDKKSISQTKFADTVGASDTTISQLIAGKTWIGRDLARRISDATKGAVTASDFVTSETEAAE